MIILQFTLKTGRHRWLPVHCGHASGSISAQPQRQSRLWCYVIRPIKNIGRLGDVSSGLTADVAVMEEVRGEQNLSRLS